MTYAPCKAADLKEGDRVRVTLEGVVKDEGDPRRIKFDGAAAATVLEYDELDAGKLERQERPLQVGDRVRERDDHDWVGEIVGPPRSHASGYVEVAVWHDEYGYCPRSADALERAP